MKRRFSYGAMAVGIFLVFRPDFPDAQAPTKPADQTKAAGTFTFVGCVKNVLPEGKPWAYSGYLQDSDTGATYALTRCGLYTGRSVVVILL